MPSTIPWSLIRFNKANAEQGVPKNDICPGTNLIDHAESIAMWTLSGVEVDNNLWQETVAILTEDIAKELIAGVETDDQGNEGCLCQECEQRFRVDILVPDALWRQLGMPDHAGLLCGACICRRIESLGDFAAFHLAPELIQ